MATLEGSTISSTYKDLLQVDNSNAGVDGTLRDVEDGEGTVSKLQISTAGVKSTGTLEATGDTTLGANLILGGATVGGIKDEDAMTSDSPTHLATQQSIKAYVDGKSHLALGTTSSTALAGDTTTISSGQASAITANTAKTGITSGQASAITANTAKTGITSGQASEITANTAKVTNATHTGEVTGSTALTVADDTIDEANLKVDNSPTDDYVLTAKSSAAGGLTWAEVSGGGGGGSGDITSVVAGTGLTGGATTGAATLNVDVGIADDKIAQIDSASVADDDFARFTANGLEGRSASEVLSDIGAAASGHAHGLNNLSDVDTTGAASGKIIKHNGSSWAVADDTDTNTNQLTTFTVSATTDTTATTISQGDDLMFAAGTGITCETTADGTVTIAATGGGTVTSVGGTGTVNGLTLTGTVTGSGNLTLGGTLPVEIGVACSDETTALTVADNKVRFMIPEAMTLTEVKASLVGAESDASGMDIDVRYHATDPTNAGATVFSGGDLNIAQNTYYGTKSSLAVTSLAENGFIMVDINGPVGSPDATGLKIWLIGTK